jgi:hypothetical protein
LVADGGPGGKKGCEEIMATTYTLNEAVGRAIERARQDVDSYCVFRNRERDCIVRHAWATPPRGDFERVCTASCSDTTSTVVVRFS